MFFSLLVTAREGLEMALIITILLGYLRSVGQKQHFRQIWLGVGVAVVLSVAFGAGLKIASHELDGRVLEAFEGFTMLFAVVVLTWMLFWMKAQSGGISQGLKSQMDRALSRSSTITLGLLAFSAVGREGFETSLFLFAGSTSATAPEAFIGGGLLGFAAAAAVGVVMYYGFARLPLQQFFLISGLVLIALASGLISNSITELHGSGLIRDIGQRPWDTEATLSMSSSPGKFLHAVLGYDSAPGMVQIILYWSYFTGAVFAYTAWPVLARRFRRLHKPQAAAAAGLQQVEG